MYLTNWKNDVPQPLGRRDIIKKKYQTNDIQTLILECDAYNAAKRFVKKIAQRLKGRNDKETARNVHDFIKANVRYVKDDINRDAVKDVNVTLYEGFADCKALTIAVGAFLRELGISYKIRFVGYDETHRITHVYLVALCDGKEVVIDCVYPYFGGEMPYKYVEDYYLFPNYQPATINGIIEPKQIGGFAKAVFLILTAYSLYTWSKRTA